MVIVVVIIRFELKINFDVKNPNFFPLSVEMTVNSFPISVYGQLKISLG